MRRVRNRQSGSAFFIILIAIMMFALLSYAVSQGSRSSASSLSKEQLEVASQEISAFGSTLANAIQTLRLRGCSAEQISFASMPVAGNANPVSPSDGSCDVFSLAGGKVTYTPPVSTWLNDADVGKDGYREWFFTDRTCIPDVGTGGATCGNASEMEILMVLPWVRQDLCDAYNKYVDWQYYETVPIPGEAGTAYNYTEKVDGVFQNGSNINTWDDMMSDVRTLCFRGAGAEPNGGHHIYFVLMAR